MLTQLLKKITPLKAGRELPKRVFLKLFPVVNFPGILRSIIQELKYLKFRKRDDEDNMWLVH
ncbi:MAG: hypothetical protein JWQ40_3274 [Segetibacter sp.]|nr:hypothetical protein [Segetibacter sp.]